MKILLIILFSFININVFSKNYKLPETYNSFKYEVLNFKYNNIAIKKFSLTKEDYTLIITNTTITSLFILTYNTSSIDMTNKYLYFLIPDILLNTMILLIKYYP